MPLPQTAFDELPNTCNAMPYAQPNRLATLATLFGMTPPDLSTCRVLELGCCDASNIIPTAYALPEATITGVDTSEQNIKSGQDAIDALKLSNITLQQTDIQDINPDFGQFDYIIAHGIFSWVSPEVQDKILSICEHNLAPNGVAYIGFSTKPGWNVNNIIRDMMLYLSASIDDPTVKINQHKVLLKFLLDATKETKNPYEQFIGEEVNNLVQLPETFVCTELAKEQNEPLYFHEFMQQAKSHNLNYLSDAFLSTMLPDSFPDSQQQALQMFNGDLITQEQMIDILSNRSFRHTLLCHKDVSLNRSLSPDKLANLYVASSMQPNADSYEKFENSRGTLSTSKLIVQAALRYLGKEWPRAVAFDELLEQARQDTNSNSTTDQETITNALLIGYSKGIIELHSQSTAIVTTVSEYPQASSIASWQAKQTSKITNLRSEWLIMQNVVCLHLLPYLDGRHSHADLLNLLENWVAEDKLSLNITNQKTGEPLTLTESNRQEVLNKLLIETLNFTAKTGLLIA
ncbi:class I SAM-dependent methyltransferase [Candidatus Halobeggiatoa sp. HSG11]|nr:class I SAM-dependent methyltransferase [Candidatus Halobeggiatoa sp. HSG11]